MHYVLHKLDPDLGNHESMQEAPAEVVAALLAAGANPDQMDYVGCTALHMVCRSRASEVSRRLNAKQSCPVPAVDQYGLNFT